MSRELKARYECISDIMDSFDFRKIARIMKFLDLKWHGSEDGVPNEYELRRFARKALNQSAEAKMGYESGGFIITYSDGKEPCLNLMFVLEQCESNIVKEDLSQI
jgi:hypothetical protein